MTLPYVPGQQYPYWTKERVAVLIAEAENGDEKIRNILAELAATDQAFRLLKRTPQTVWFQEGFTPEQHKQRVAILSVSEAIFLKHRNDAIASLLNALQIPKPPH